MEELLNYNPYSFFFFFLILLRISGLFLSTPILSSNNIPSQIKIYFIVFLSLTFYLSLPKIDFKLPVTIVENLTFVASELSIGILMGIIPRFMFTAIEFAGTIIGYQMGFAIVNVVDPQSDTQVSIISSLETLLATLLFLTVDGHHIFFEVLSQSFEKLPLSSFTFSQDKIEYLMRSSADIFFLGVRLSAPLLGGLFLANMILGLLARSMPQLNVFVIGFPFTIGLGLILLILSMPIFVDHLLVVFDNMNKEMLRALPNLYK